MFFKKKMQHDYDLDMHNIPGHIAFIMDGNGRWAKKRKMPRTYGHHEGTKTIRTLALEANRLGVKAMTVYAFSTENFKREASEVEYIFKLPKEFFNLYLKELMENNEQVTAVLSQEEIDDCFNPAHHVKNVDVIFKRVGLL